MVKRVARHVQIEIAVVVEIGQQGTAGSHGNLNRGASDPRELAGLDLAKELVARRLIHAEPRGSVSKRADEQIEQAIVVNVAPGRGMYEGSP